MKNVKVQCELVDKRAVLPQYAHEGDACADLRVLVDLGVNKCTWVGKDGKNKVYIEPNSTVILDTGIVFKFPKGYGMMIYSRSGLGIKHSVVLANQVGIIDSKYTETTKIALRNLGKEGFIITDGDRVAQFQIVPYPNMVFEEVEHIEKTDRGEGLGSSGVK